MNLLLIKIISKVRQEKTKAQKSMKAEIILTLEKKEKESIKDMTSASIILYINSIMDQYIKEEKAESIKYQVIRKQQEDNLKLLLDSETPIKLVIKNPYRVAYPDKRAQIINPDGTPAKFTKEEQYYSVFVEGEESKGATYHSNMENLLKKYDLVEPPITGIVAEL